MAGSNPGGGQVPQGQVIVGGGHGFAPGVYTGKIGGLGRSWSWRGSNNPLDYLNPFGGTTKGGSGTGVPTQKAIGTGVGVVSNLLLPGSGFITGPLGAVGNSFGARRNEQAAGAAGGATKGGARESSAYA